jgi:hypothetical protein
MRSPSPRFVVALVAALAIFNGAGCGSGTGQDADITRAEQFASFPLYWVGPRFEKWDLSTIQGLDRPREFVSFIYGTCTQRGAEQPGCAPSTGRTWCRLPSAGSGRALRQEVLTTTVPLSRLLDKVEGC